MEWNGQLWRASVEGLEDHGLVAWAPTEEAALRNLQSVSQIMHVATERGLGLPHGAIRCDGRKICVQF